MPEGAARAGRPAAFLDRDGTVVEERHFLADPADVSLVPGTVEALRRLRAAGFLLVVVTNQSGIARGLYGEADYRAVRARLDALLADAGVALDATYHCPHHPDFTGPCDCRKPGVGMYRRAEAELGVRLDRSVYVGDRLKDVLPARVLGGLPLLVRTGYGAEQAAEAPPDVAVVADLAAAAERAARWLGDISQG